VTAVKASAVVIDNELLRDAAKRICGGRPSTRFMELLVEQVSLLPKLIAGIEHWPLRTAMRDRLDDARRAAGLLSRELEDIDFASIATLGTANLNYIALAAQLRVLERMTALAFESIRSGPGADLAPGLINGGAALPRPPKLVCAVIAASAWKAARGQQVPHTRPDPKQAASEIWRAAGNVESGDIDSWGYWLKMAKDHDETDLARGSLVPRFVEQWLAADLA
jgi:hypothetical protein